MRGTFRDQGGLFSYISPEARVPANHPSRSRSDRGVATVRSVTRNQRNEVVQRLTAKLIVPRRI
jgi:acyl dehydratase